MKTSVINTPRCRPRRKFCAFPSREKCPGTESFYLTSDPPAGGERGAHSHARDKKEQTKGKEKKKKKRNRERERERRKREKHQRTGVGGACASMHRGVRSHGVASRRQASSVARRAPSYSHVTSHLVARAHAGAVVVASFGALVQFLRESAGRGRRSGSPPGFEMRANSSLLAAWK